jgi:hypothetical protein
MLRPTENVLSGVYPILSRPNPIFTTSKERAGRALRPAFSFQTANPFRNIHLNDHAHNSLRL